MFNNRYQFRTNALRPYATYKQQYQQPQIGTLPWQAERTPSHMFQQYQQYKQQQPQQNVAVGDEVAVRPPPTPQFLRNALEPLVCDAYFPAIIYQNIDGWMTRPVGLANESNRPSPGGMKDRQARYHTLSRQEQQKQDVWAFQQIQHLAMGICPEGYEWYREDRKKRYRCKGRNHLITDESLARGGSIETITMRELRDEAEAYSSISGKARKWKRKERGFFR